MSYITPFSLTPFLYELLFSLKIKVMLPAAEKFKHAHTRAQVNITNADISHQ